MVARTRKRAKKYSPKKLTSRKKPRKSDYVKTLEKRVKELELKQLKQPENIQEINKRVEALEQEKTEKPVSGHVEAGRKWSQSPKGEDWKNDINAAKELLLTRYKQIISDKNPSISGIYPIKLAGFIRNNKTKTVDQHVETVIQEILKEKEEKESKTPKQPASAPLPEQQETAEPEQAIAPEIQKPLSPKRLYLPTPQNNEYYQTNQETIPKTPLIGGFFDDSDSEDDEV
jgi:hypothetical protein